MPDFLLEIGTEEVPASAVVPALDQLSGLTRDLLRRERISAGEIRTVGTPRRLVVYAAGVAARQEDAVIEHRGPTRQVAFDAAGNPTRAAEGFARKFGLTPADLAVRTRDGGEYVFAEQKVEGKAAAEVLGGAIPALLSALSFPKFMRWGEGRFRFSRPIRWLVALLGEEVVPFEIEGVRSGRESSGHRFLPVGGAAGGSRLPIGRAEEYFTRMEDACVMVDPEERRRRIVEQGEALAAADGVRVVWDEGLLHDVVYTVEYPTAFLGRFSEEYLQLPRPVLVSAMRKHQRYFYLENADGSLAPRFLAVRNGGEHGLEVVREGNERVLIFRFNDAVHHDVEDRKSTLEEKREQLRRIVFMEGLGTMWDKSARLEAVVSGLCEQLGLEELRNAAMTAAHLCKADLATHMVAELPELQGVIGQEYALREGLAPEVGQAIAEHYQPKGAGDPLPRSLPGRLLALADRFDLLAAAYSLGHAATGSSDPFGLRRAAAGVVALLSELPPTLRLSGLADLALSSFADEPYYAQANPRPPGEVRAELLLFLRPRLEAILQEEGIRLDLVEAALGAGFDSVPDTLDRARFLQQQSTDPSWDAVVAVGTRIRNILKPGDGGLATGDGVQGSGFRVQEEPTLTERLEHPAEKRLLEEIESRQQALQGALDRRDWNGAWSEWDALRPTVDQFFLDVLVNADDPELRAARQALLRRLDRTFTRLADFSRIAAL
jgi:glycyl-tRNA synthetase beta chain